MKKLLLAAVTVAFSAGSVAAADIAARPYTKAPTPMEPVHNWAGLYVGGHVGDVWGDSRYDFLELGFFNLAAGESFTHTIDGLVGGVHAGYNFQMSSNVVVGLEGSFSGTNVKGKAASPFFLDDAFDTQIRWIATVTPRLGATSGAWLLYVKGGAAFANIRTEILSPPNDVHDLRAETKAGWTVGGGVEWMAHPNWIIGIESNYYDFHRCCDGLVQATLLSNNASAAPLASNHGTSIGMWSVLGRVSYKFGGPIAARY